MADEPVIVFDQVSKMYHKRAGMGTLWSMIPGLRPRGRDEFWALRDVSFEVRRGECLGIIGPNGAGKSTILKILSKITSPTTGRFEVRGRLSSLIEVGAGFHPELTGRENVYLNAAILGMSRKETDAKFRDIVDFAELWDFIDVPVKRYSSGMYVRLGFSIAVHTEPDVLLVDEVLAVGDMRFQGRCFERFGELRRRRASMVLVSHSMNLIDKVCDHAVLLYGGRVVERGDVPDVTDAYRRLELESEGEGRTVTHPDVEVTEVRLLDASGAPAEVFEPGSRLTVRTYYEVRRPLAESTLALSLFNNQGDNVTVWRTELDGCQVDTSRPHRGCVDLVVDHLPLAPGSYWLSVHWWRRVAEELYCYRERAARFLVTGGNPTSGLCYVPHRWEGTVPLQGEPHHGQ